MEVGKCWWRRSDDLDHLTLVNCQAGSVLEVKDSNVDRVMMKDGENPPRAFPPGTISLCTWSTLNPAGAVSFLIAGRASLVIQVSYMASTSRLWSSIASWKRAALWTADQKFRTPKAMEGDKGARLDGLTNNGPGLALTLWTSSNFLPNSCRRRLNF